MAKTREIQKPSPQESRALVPVQPAMEALLVPTTNEAAKAFLAESKGERYVPKSIPLIGIDQQEAQFVLPSGEVVDQVEGYPIHTFQTRRYYLKQPQAGQKGQRPDCFSLDMIRPDTNSLHKQCDTCADCKHSQWGSSRSGSGQACGTRTWLFLLNPAFGSPPLGVLNLSPANIEVLLGTETKTGYLGRASARHGCYEIVWTSLSLKQLGEQVKYCVVEPVMGEAADMPRAKILVSIRNGFQQMMEAVRGQTGEAEDEGGNGTPSPPAAPEDHTTPFDEVDNDVPDPAF